jgi:hypothetical protein
MMFGNDGQHHICHLFAGTDEQDAVAVTLFSDGLLCGEACLLITSPHATQDWTSRLQAGGIDVLREQQRGALTFLAGGEPRTACECNSIARAGELLEFVRKKRGIRGIRIVADFEWGFSPPLPADMLCHWEATADLALENLNVRSVCQYDLRRSSPSQLCSALRTHRMAVVGQQLYRSPFFEAPRILTNEPRLNHSLDDRKGVDLMLGELEPMDGFNARHVHPLNHVWA